MAPPPPNQNTSAKGPLGHYHQQAWLQPSANLPSPTQQPHVRQSPPVQGFPAQQLAQQPPRPVYQTQSQQTSAQQPIRQQPYGQQAVVHQQFSQQVAGQQLVPTHVSPPVPVVAGYQQQVGGYAGGYAQQGMVHAQHAHQSTSRTSSSTTTTTTTQTTQQQQQRQQQQSAGQVQQHQQLQIRQAPPAPQIQHHQQLQIQQAPAAPQIYHQQQQMQYVQRAQPPSPPQIVQYASPPPQVQYVAPPPPVQYIAPPPQAPVHHTTNYTTIYQAAPAQPPPQQQVVQTSSAQVVQQQRPRSRPLQLHVNITDVTLSSSSSLQTRPKSPPPQVRPPSPPRQLALPSPARHSSRHDQGINNSSTTTTTITNITRTEAESRGADFLERYDEEMARRLLVVCPPCPAGFGWEAQEDGYECEAGSHLIPYTETDAWIAGLRPGGDIIGKMFTVDEVRERYLRRAIRNGLDPRLAGELSRRSEQRSGGRRGRMPRRGRMFDDDDDDDDDLFSAFSAASRRQGMRDPFK
ncbi:hypothetical protein B0A48_01460 [Cryoendolithus antarcticus]|uniref:Uncharacterized protein n=1 Tax=Cryoendolithus antarcticus TaxID=1507870 RepID=A0A1V8TPV2_9PEZI|nr:hypothetical protein B0A48_01460 [Cryoendolithus antarcticus]